MRFALLTSFCALALSASAFAQDSISLRGSTVVARALSVAESTIQKDLGISMTFSPENAGLELADKLGAGLFDIALYTRKITPQEVALRPDKKFTETLIGRQVVVVVVPNQVWKSGVHALTKDQLRGIYEGDITNWKQVGGEDNSIVFYNREAGRGIWDLYMIFLYGDVRRAPLSKAEVLKDAGEIRNSVAFNAGSLSILEHGELRGENIHALGIKLEDGTIVEPTDENIANGKYEIARPLYMVTGKNPTGKIRALIEFMEGKEGQEAVAKAGHLPLTAFDKK